MMEGTDINDGCFTQGGPIVAPQKMMNRCALAILDVLHIAREFFR